MKGLLIPLECLFFEINTLFRNKKKFEKDLHISREAFVLQINDLAREVSLLSRYKEANKVDEIIIDIRKLEKQVNEAHTKMNLFKSRERFFGFTETQYEEVLKISK